MDYGGIGRLNLFLYIMVFVLCLSVTTYVFNPPASSGDELTEFGWAQEKSTGNVNNPFAFIGTIFGIIAGFFTFIIRGLFLDIPAVPEIVKLFICAPLWILLLVVIADYLNEFLNSASNFIDAVNPFS